MQYPWLTSQWQNLIQQQQAGRLHHAYLLTGMCGLGQLDFARQLAQYLLCRSPQADKACGLCQSCQLLQANNHPDLIEVQPAEGKKSISIDRIRQLSADVAQTSTQGGLQIVIIEPAEAMTLAAANGLLKTLEEPPADVLFLLISYEAGRLPNTILSRCQPLPMTVNASASQWLQQQLPGVDPELALALANGAPLLALEQANNGFLEQRQTIWQQWLAVQQRETTWQAASKALKDIEKATVLTVMQSIVTDVLKLQLGAAPGLCINKDWALDLLNHRLPTQTLLDLQKQLESLRRLVQKGAGINFDLQLLELWRLWCSTSRRQVA